METRRNFLKKSAAIASGISLMGLGGTTTSGCNSSNDPLFKISLAEWSLNRSIRNGEVDHLDFAKIAKRNFNINAIEYVNQLFADKTGGSTYIKEMKDRIEVALIIGTSLMAIGSLAAWGAWLLASSAI